MDAHIEAINAHGIACRREASLRRDHETRERESIVEVTRIAEAARQVNEKKERLLRATQRADQKAELRLQRIERRSRPSTPTNDPTAIVVATHTDDDDDIATSTLFS
jgi:hypothetical protein